MTMHYATEPGTGDCTEPLVLTERKTGMSFLEASAVAGHALGVHNCGLLAVKVTVTERLPGQREPSERTVEWVGGQS